MGVGNDFTDYMGYRYCELESRIDDCLTAIAAGETSLEVDCTDLTRGKAELKIQIYLPTLFRYNKIICRN